MISQLEGSSVQEATELMVRWFNFEVPDWRLDQGSLMGWSATTQDFQFPESR